MKAWVLSLLMILALHHGVMSGEILPEGRSQSSVGPVESNGLQICYYRRDKDKAGEIWLINHKTGNQVFLYEYDRTAQAQISPDGNYVVVTDRYASNATQTVLLRRSEKGNWGILETGDIEKKGLQLLARTFDLKSSPSIDHLYSNVLGVPDSLGNIDVVIWGYQSGRQTLDHWFFSYNLATGRTFLPDAKAAKKGGNPLKDIVKNAP